MSTDSLAYARMRWSESRYGWTETTAETYYDMLGAVPPLRRDGDNFISGEPYDNRNGDEVYYVVVMADGPAGRSYWVRLWTELEYVLWKHNGRSLNEPAVKVVTLSPDGTPSQT